MLITAMCQQHLIGTSPGVLKVTDWVTSTYKQYVVDKKAVLIADPGDWLLAW